MWISKLSAARAIAGFGCGIGLSLAAAACDDSECRGQEQCRCTAEALCLEGLTCLSNYCVRVDGSGDPGDPPPAGGGSSANGSGDSSSDNVAACQAWVDDFECAGFDGAGFAACDELAEFECDVTAYYECLDDNANCSDLGPDVVAWADCAELLSCE